MKLKKVGDNVYDRPRKMIGKLVFFLDIIGHSEAFSEHRFQVSGVRFQAGSRFFTTDT